MTSTIIENAPGSAARIDAARSAGFDPERLKRISERYARGVDQGEIPGAVVIVMRDGNLVYEEAIGFSDRAAGAQMTADTVFWLASMTKPVTSVATMMLVEQGLIELAAPISRYLPSFANATVGTVQKDGTLDRKPPSRAPTVHDLLRHTAGIVYGEFGNTPVHQAYLAESLFTTSGSLADIVDRIAALPLAHEPGSTWEYSLATDVLARVVEVVSGTSIGKFFEERITGPLGMLSTNFHVRYGAAIAWSDELAGGPLRQTYEAVYRTPPGVESGGGGLHGTARDYARFCQMLLDGGELDGVRLLAPRSVAFMAANHLPDGIRFPPGHADILGAIAPIPQLGQGFGLGFAVRTDPGLHPAPGSVGDFYWAGAGGTYFWIDPAEKLVVVSLTAQPNFEHKAGYRQLIRGLVYQALVDSRQRLGQAGARTSAHTTEGAEPGVGSMTAGFSFRP